MGTWWPTVNTEESRKPHYKGHFFNPKRQSFVVRKIEWSTLTNTDAGPDWEVANLEEYKTEVQEKHETQSSPINDSLPEKGRHVDVHQPTAIVSNLFQG